MAGTDEILDFWFSQATPQDWYAGSPEFDATIRARFLPACEALTASAPENHLADARSALAAIIVLDQFNRNVFRGTARAFAGDATALAIAREAIGRGYDAEFGKEERQFLYMPFMHSENLADQERCVALFKALGDEDSVSYAIEHRDIVARFGRFPHRNRALGRETTEAEAAFLSEHQGFGQ